MFLLILVVTFPPRFIINMRELHLRNVLGGRDMGIDSGFGLSSRVPGMSSIRFADPGTLGITEGDVEMHLVGGNTSSAQQAAEGDGGMRDLGDGRVGGEVVME